MKSGARRENFSDSEDLKDASRQCTHSAMAYVVVVGLFLNEVYDTYVYNVCTEEVCMYVYHSPLITMLYHREASTAHRRRVLSPFALFLIYLNPRSSWTCDLICSRTRRILETLTLKGW